MFRLKNKQCYSFQLECEVCPECLRIGRKSYLRYFHISLKESIYKCGDSKCMYPFVDFKYKSSQDQSVYRYQQIETKPPNKIHSPQSPAKFGDISLDIDWLDGNSSLYETVKASDTVADEYSLNDSSVLANLLNLGDDNVLDNYNINEFIDNICNERCTDEAAEQYILTELLQPSVAVIKTPALVSLHPSTPPKSLNLPWHTPPKLSSQPQKSTTAESVTPKLTKCLQFISEQPVATATTYNKKTSKRQRKKVKQSTPKVNEPIIPKTENILKEEPIAVPTERQSAVQNLLNNRKNYRPLDWIQSLQSLTSKNNNKLELDKPEPAPQIVVRPFKGNIKKEKEVKVKKEVLDVSVQAHYEADAGDEPFKGFTKRSLAGHLNQLNNLNKLAFKINALKVPEIREFC